MVIRIRVPTYPHQEARNGPLTADFRARINKLRTERRLTLADIGQAFGVSGPFMSTLLREHNPASVRSMHIPRFVKALEDLEMEGSPEPANTDVQQHDPEHDPSLDDLIRLAHSKGFAVTFTPLPVSNDNQSK